LVSSLYWHSIHPHHTVFDFCNGRCITGVFGKTMGCWAQQQCIEPIGIAVDINSGDDLEWFDGVQMRQGFTTQAFLDWLRLFIVRTIY
jgi:hypothetical protein